MMKLLLSTIYFLLLLQINVKAQVASFELYPAFTEKSTMLIDKQKLLISMVINEKTYETKLVNSSLTDSVFNLLMDQDFYDDCIACWPVIKASKNDTIATFFTGRDGIIVKGSCTIKEKTDTFKFWSPKEHYKPNQLFKYIIQLVFSDYSDNYEVTSYFEKINDYFMSSNSFQVRITNENPLIHRIFGAYNCTEKDKMMAYFFSFSKNENLIIDIRRYGDLSNAYFDTFVALRDSNYLVQFKADNSNVQAKLLNNGFKNDGIISNHHWFEKKTLFGKTKWKFK